MKEFMCVEVKHHRDVAKTIEQFQKNGWSLHTYQVAAVTSGSIITCSSRKASKTP